MRLLIIGGPRTGKTTKARALSEGMELTLISLDSIASTHTWSDTSDVVCGLLESPGNWIIEGASGVRGLRKWLRKHPGKPDFEIVYLDKVHVAQTVGQKGMAKGVETIWHECLDMMRGRE